MIITEVLNFGSELLGKKWRMVVIYHLIDGPKRFSELKALIPGCSVKMLSEVLEELTDNHLLERKQYSTIPVKVTYEIKPAFLETALVIPQLKQKLESYLIANRHLYKLSPSFVEQLTKK